MLPEQYRLVCPKDDRHKEFSATAHVTEEWEVNDQGDFLSVISSLETTHAPGMDDMFICRECGAEAKKVVVKEAKRAELASVTFNFKDHHSIGIPVGRGFRVVPGTLKVVVALADRFCVEWETGDEDANRT